MSPEGHPSRTPGSPRSGAEGRIRSSPLNCRIPPGAKRRGERCLNQRGQPTSTAQNQTRLNLRLVEGCVMAHFICSIPRSLQIFRARLSSISECLGIEDRLFWLGFHHHEWRLPSLINSHFCDRRYFSSSLRFIPRFFLLYILNLQRR